jgi:hypothetical protein
MATAANETHASIPQTASKTKKPSHRFRLVCELHGDAGVATRKNKTVSHARLLYILVDGAKFRVSAPFSGIASGRKSDNNENGTLPETAEGLP